MFRKIVQFHGAPDFDIYHCQFGNNGYIASGLKELGIIKGKIITTFHGYDAHFEDKKLQNYYRTGIRTWSRLLFKHSDLITVNTPYLFKQVRALGANPDKIELLPMGVDTTFFKPGQNPRNLDTLRLVSIGRLLELKSHDLGIQAVSEIVAEGVNLKYLIIGEGPQRQNLLQLIDRLNLKKHVKLLGHQSQAEIRNILQDSDIFLMTSTFDGSGRREAQGLVTAEAQACGLPVVAFRSGGVPYTIEEGTTGFLAEEKNVGEFAHHLKNLCADEALRKDMGRAARKFVERSFCLSRLAQKQLSLYEKVLQR